MTKKRKKKNEVEKIDEENLDEEEYHVETKFEVFMRNYREVPSFKALVKLSAYFIFFLVLIIIVNAIGPRGNSHKNKTEDTTTTEAVVKFQDMLDELLNNKQYKCEIEIDGKGYILNGLYGNKILTGSLFTNEGTYSYKLQDNIVYEVKLNNKIQNDELLKDINKRIIDNYSLVDIIRNSSGIKVENGFKYNRVTVDDSIFSLEIIVNDNHIKNINMVSDNSSYKFTYDEVFLID